MKLRIQVALLVRRYVALVAYTVALLLLCTLITLHLSYSNHSTVLNNRLDARHDDLLPAQKTTKHIDANKYTKKPFRRKISNFAFNGQCKQSATIGIYIGVRNVTAQHMYHVALKTVECYAQRHNYSLFIVDLTNDPVVIDRCSIYSDQMVYFRRHCALAVYMERHTMLKWWLAIDADVMVINQDRCIEEYIDERVQVIFYERYFNWEIMTGGALVKNTQWARTFMDDFAKYELALPNSWHGNDNGAIHIHMLKTILPESQDAISQCQRLWEEADDVDHYYQFVVCCRSAIGAKHVWPPYFKLLRRGHGWAFDQYLLQEDWCERSFMAHGYKMQKLTEPNAKTPFERLPEGIDCQPGAPWPHIASHRKSCDALKSRIRMGEQYFQQSYASVAQRATFLLTKDIFDCWPNCNEDG